MKRILSLFLSFVLVFSMCFNSICVEALSSTTYIIPPETVAFNMVTNEVSIASGTASGNKYLTYEGNETANAVHIYKSANANTSNPTIDTTTFPGKSVLAIPYNSTTMPFIQLGRGNMIANKSSGRINLYSGKILLTEADDPSWQLNNNGNTATMNEALKANTWYSFSAELDLTDGVNTLTVTYTEELSAASSAEAFAPHTVSAQVSCDSDTVNYMRVKAGTSGCTIYYDDLKLSYITKYVKAKITNIGTSGVVDAGQKVIPVELSEGISGITKDHITVKNSTTNDTISVDKIVVSDGAKHTLDVHLSSNLLSWSEYELTIDALAFGEGSKQKIGDGTATDVTDITESFETTKPPFATKGFEITKESGNIKARGLVANTSGSPIDMKLVFAPFGSDGRPLDIEPTNYDDFNNADGEYVEAQVTAAGADKFSFFIIDNWTDKKTLLGTFATVDADGNDISETAVSGGTLPGTTAAISADELNHTDIKLSVRVDVKEADVTDGVIFVYKKGENLSDTNLPIYAEAVSTAADGTLSKVIPLPKTLGFGEYIVEFSSEKLSDNLTDSFNHYSADELLAARKSEIFADAKAATTEAGLKEVLLGLNSNDEEVNSNFDLFGADADMTDYEAAYDKDNIFTRMLTSVSGLADYDALVELFEQCSADQIQYEIENPIVMIERPVTLVADTTNTAEYGSVRGNYKGSLALTTDGTKNHWMYISTNNAQEQCYEVTNDTSFASSVVKLKKLHDAYIEMFFGGSIPGGASIVRNSLNKAKGTIEGKIRFTQSVTPTWTMNPLGGISEGAALNDALKADTWYSFKWEIVTGSYIQVSFAEIGSDSPHLVTKKWNYSSDTFTYLRLNTNLSDGESMYLDDIKMYYDSVPYEKAKILSVGTDGVVNYNQNTVSMELSQKIPELKSEHIKVINKQTNEVINADTIAVSGDTTQTVQINLASNLAAWSEYTISIDAASFGEGVVQRVGNQQPTAVTGLTYDFETNRPPFASRPFVFTNIGDTLNAKALVSNTSGEPKNMQFIFANFDASGRFVSIVPTEHAGFVSSDGAYLEANTPTQGSEKFNFFVIDDWTSRKPLFGANYMVNSLGNSLSKGEVLGCESIASSAAAMELGEFDYDNTKIVAKIDTKENKVVDGVLFVYKNGEVLSATNLPVYAKAVSTSGDGTLTTEIVLPKDIAYAGYTVEFISDKLSGPVSKTFRYYSPDEILANKRASVLADAKAASSAEILSEVLTGVNSAGEKVNDNFDIFGKDADMTKYNKNIDKLNVFTAMLPSLSGISSYDALVDLFETCASAQRANEVASQKLTIVNGVKQASNTQSLRQIILGVDSNGNKINDNFDVISANADMSIYNSLKNKAAVFNHMLNSINTVSDYNSVISLFESAARTQKSKENTPPSTSSNNTSFGGSHTPVKETVNTPVQNPNGDTSVSASVFTDMGGHWAQNYVEALYKRGIMKGYEDSSFRANNSITRAELAKTIVEAFEISANTDISFKDIDLGSWYSAYVASAAAAGIVNGFEDGTFGPDMAITRQDAALMIYRALSKKVTLSVGYTFFTDDRDISLYASGAIRTLGDLGIVSGNENKQFKPNNPITRAEIATLICRALDYIESH